MTDYDGQSGFNGNNVTGTKLDTVVLWHGTSLPSGANNEVPQYGFFCLVDSLISPTSQTWYIQTSATISSPNFVILPDAIDSELPYLKLSTTISDYTQPASAVASSSNGTITAQITQALSDAFEDLDGSPTRTGNKAATGSALIGLTVTAYTAYLHKTGSPTATITCNIRDSADVVQLVLGTMPASSLTGASAAYKFENLTGRVIASGDRITIEYAGDASNIVHVAVKSANPYDGVNTHNSTYTGVWNEWTADDQKFIIEHQQTITAAHAVDNLTTSNWKSSLEANPNIYVDLTSIREIVGLAINIDKTATTITSLKIRASTDTTFTDSENIAYVNISDFTDDTWRFLANNFLEDNRRYVQFYANETGVLSINEIKVRYGVSDLLKILNHRHATRTVLSADSFVDSN
jgi:hypothetical protein